MSERDEIEKLLKLIDVRLNYVMLPVRRAAVAAINRAKDRNGVIPEYRLAYLQNICANLLDGVFGTSPADQFDGDIPKTPIARLINDATDAAARIVVDPYVAQVRNIEATNVRAALLRGRPDGAPQRIVDPLREWIDPNGYTLSSRMWQAGSEVRATIDQLLEFHIGQGTNAVQIGKELERFLTIDGATKLVPDLDRRGDPKLNGDGSIKMKRVPRTTKTPYGAKGLYVPRRLARTETTRALGNATIEVARMNPFVRAVKWRLSGSHPRVDICDEYASANRYDLGAGNYPPNKVPTYPPHPQCLCTLIQVVIDDPEKVVAALGRWVRGERMPEFDGVGEMPADADAIVRWLAGTGEK